MKFGAAPKTLPFGRPVAPGAGRLSVRDVSTPLEPENLAELIGDCADIPQDLRRAREAVPLPPAPASWSVNDSCLAQVADLDDYA
jgi:hypothetical protein